MPAQKRPKEPPSVAIYIPTSTSWGRRVISGVLEYAKVHGPWNIYIEPRGPTDSFQLPPKSWDCDGLITRMGSHAMARSIRESGLPAVNTSSIRVDNDDFPRIITSSIASGRLAVGLFISRGLSHFAYVGNPTEDYVQSQFEAFQRLVAERGRTCAFFKASDPVDQLIAWLKSLPKPVGIFCWGPSIGHTVIDACRKAGILVPHDVAVLGADHDDLLSEASHPAQSGIRIAAEQIGMTAAAILDGAMHGKRPAKMEWHIEPQGIIEKLSTDTLAVDDRRMAAAARFILEHAHEPISVDDVITANPMARRSLERKFRQLFGNSIVEHIRQIRLNKARLLLAGTDIPVTLIAEKCGFSSYNYMGRIFQEANGLTPRDYRTQCRVKKL